MSLEKKKKIRKEMFGYGGKIVWAPNNEVAKKKFDELMKLRKQYEEAGGTFKK